MTTMDVPSLVNEALGEESITGGVSLGDEDAVCFTPTRTLLYRGDGLLSDEGVSEFPHDFTALALSEGRRKTTFELTYVDGESSFSVPPDRTDAVLEQLLEGALRASGPLGAEESLEGVFRFSELTLVITDRQLLKHIGAATWDEEFEAYPYDEVTGLEFEEGSVATSVVLQVGGRPERIKAPNDQAHQVRQSLQSTLFEYHDVDSLSALNDELAAESAAAEPSDAGLNLEAGIDPLTGGGETSASSEPATPAVESPPADPPERPGSGTGGATGSAVSTPSYVKDETDDVQAQLADLTAAVERHSELLESQQELIEQLIAELKTGR
jgi:hypothetical protein